MKCDGERVGKVKSGESIEFEALPGVHEIRAHMGWQASRPVEISLETADSEAELELSTSQDPNNPSDMGILRGLLRPRSSIQLRRVDPPD